MLHLPDAVSWVAEYQFRAPYEPHRRGAWRIFCFKCILILAQSTSIGCFMVPVVISAGDLKTRASGLGQAALLCSAAWLLSSIGLTVTYAAIPETSNWGSLLLFLCGKCTVNCDWNQRIYTEENIEAQGTLTDLEDFKFVYIHSFFLFPHYLGLWM